MVFSYFHIVVIKVNLKMQWLINNKLVNEPYIKQFLQISKSLSFYYQRISLYTLKSHMRCTSFWVYPANKCMLKVNNANTRRRGEMCSKLTIKTPELHLWRHPVVFIVGFEYVSHILVFLWMWTGKYLLGTSFWSHGFPLTVLNKMRL